MISVIIPVYNMEKYLDECVRSVLEQDYGDIELLLVDDGSKDDSLKLCNVWAERDKRVRVFHKENGGQGSARNLALDNIRGEYISFIDSDDLVAPDIYSFMMSVMEDTDSDMVICETKTFTDGTYPQLKNECGPIEYKTMSAFEAMECRMNSQRYLTDSPCNKLYRARLFEKLRFTPGRLLEDSATMYRIVDLCKKITYTNKAGYFIRNNPTSVSRVKYNVKRCDTMITYEEMAEFISESESYKSLTSNVHKLANGAVFYNAGEFFLSGIIDKEVKGKIKAHARKQLRSYKDVGLKNKLLLFMIANSFGLYGTFYKINKR